ncbi:MAG: FAD-dependent oxidoreductase, partial [Clostridia bacterium]|nr:FAD-dependent oxidoreductase [Clostridia bacterium]
IVADPITLETSQPGVFAGGDVVTGPAIAVEAVAQGKEAAISIMRYLAGQDLREGRARREKAPMDTTDVPLGLEKKPRAVMPHLPVAERIKGFQEVALGLTEEAAVEEAARCLSCGVCSECYQCVAACRAQAINHDMKEEIVEIEVGAVILCPGFDEFDPSLLHNYGYRKYVNVVTSIEFERILNASGPFEGILRRPSDREYPKKIAWIQCIGSRDESVGCGYCSSVCCTYAVKEAIIAKEHSVIPLETAIFFMDMRTYGKDFDKYYERGKEEHNIRFIRSKVYSVEEVEGTGGSLLIKYLTEDGRLIGEQFDMVVLSVGLRPPKGAVELARKLGLQLNKYEFVETHPFAPMSTSREGIFVCGAFSGPKDIPETVIQASGAAGEASALLAPARHTLVKEKVYPPEKDVSGEEPRVGVFVCHCGVNIGGWLDVPAVKEYAATLPGVVFADENLYTCSQDTQERIKEKILEHNLNRVVVASCSPRTHEPLFQETIREAGLNRYLFEMANIRDQCSWVHMQEREKATEKAKDLVRMAVAKARLIRPLEQQLLGTVSSALVVGGGVAGMNSALTLANQGFDVHLVEKDAELGGMARRI